MSIKYILIQINPNLEFSEEKRIFCELNNKIDIKEKEKEKELLLLIVDEQMDRIKQELNKKIVKKDEYPKIMFDVGQDIVRRVQKLKQESYHSWDYPLLI